MVDKLKRVLGTKKEYKEEVGEKILLPHLLNQKIRVLDYIIISHFDLDHCGALIYVMQKIKVKNVIIGKQFEASPNYQGFKKIVIERNIKVYVVEAGQRINIEKNLYLDILWPKSNNVIAEKVINNNSLVCKLIYNKFSMLFTGDIEGIAEKQILSEYKNIDILKSDIIKIAHHGSRTSSTPKFLERVHPKIALIGVGDNNKFGHPDNELIKRIHRLRN